jgi:hypothetical protein
VVLLTTALGSIEEAKDWLKATGISLSVQTIQRMSYQFAQRVRQRQQLGELTLQERAEGRRVVVSIDGGRIRIRSNKRGRKSRKGRRHYDTHWREPKLLIIYVVNAEGRLDREWSPIMDGLLQTRGDAADDLFELLKCYLQLIGIQEADKVLLVADGARWIWKRFGKLVQSLGLDTKRVMELIDFYHAVEQLGKIAQLKRSWNATRRKAWVSKQKTRLKKGQIDQMLHAITAICRGRLSKELRTARDYFFNNRERLDYRKMARLKLPRGSGAIESAVRRVVNLRLKGAGIFWLEDSANAMLLLRSYYKAGRIDDLMTMAFATPLKTAA